ncbi:S8 family serine peptidase [soil metagenome]
MRLRSVAAVSALAVLAAVGFASQSHAELASGGSGASASDVPTPGSAGSDWDGVIPEYGVSQDVAPEIGDVVQGTIAIDLEDSASDADIADIGTSIGHTLRAASDESKEDKIELADVDPFEAATLLDRLRADSRVEHAEALSVLRATFIPDDPLYASKQWHMKKVGAESAWEYTCGRGVTVAVIDTGVACFDKGPFSRGSDLGGTRCEGGWNFIDNNADAVDDQGHGTHVAGTIAQTTNNGKGTAGLAYCATLMPVKVLNGRGWGTNVGVAQGIRYAADHGAQIINMSLGGPIKSKILEDAVKHARSKGVTIVAAAGNSGRAVGYPAAYPEVIAVSATDSNDNIAWFSSRGPEVAIGAPGVAVTQQTICDGGKNKCEIFGTFNGTSMASPHVAGAAAMIVSMGITDPDAIKATLQASANPKADAKLYGAGILDASAAAKRAWYMHLALRVIALGMLLFFVGRLIKKSGGTLAKSPFTWMGAAFGATGLLPFAPLTGLVSRLSNPIVDLAMRPFGEWDMVFDAGLHRFLPFANALPALAGLLLFYGAKRFRTGVGGFALGSAALLTQMAITADTGFFLGSIGLRVFAVANALVCVWVARMALDKK